MTTIREINKSYIAKQDFDWEFYLDKNVDLKKAGLNHLETAYKHWVLYGSHENRFVRNLVTGQTSQVQLKAHEKFLVGALAPRYPKTPVINAIPPQLAMFPASPIDLGYKVAIMVHLFDITLCPFFAKNINYLTSKYKRENFYVYLNIVEENINGHFQGDLKSAVANYIKDIDCPNVEYFFNENRGGDLGGGLLMSKYITDLDSNPESGIKFRYAIFVHSKKNSQWRKELCQAIFNFDLTTLTQSSEIGLVGAKKWIQTFNHPHQSEDFRRFRYHMVDLCDIYALNCDDPWQFVGGTMFIAHMDIIRYLVSHQVDEVYHRLNRLDSIDVNWLTIVTEELKKDPRGAGNDLAYRYKYGKPLVPDYMIEHAMERLIGLICHHLKLKIVGN